MSSRAPYGLWKTGIDVWLMAVETQAIMAMRIMGMTGVWSVDKRENTRMVFEKPEAFGQAAMAASLAAMSGKRPEQILAASTRPLRKKTRSNAKRLARRGPKLS